MDESSTPAPIVSDIRTDAPVETSETLKADPAAPIISDPAPEVVPQTAPIEASSTPLEPSTTTPQEFPNLHPLNKEKLKELSELGHAKMAAIVQAKHEKIMALFASPHHKTFYKTGLSNREVEIALRVSHATAARYLHDLVLAGRLKKIGAGKFLRYIKIS